MPDTQSAIPPDILRLIMGSVVGDENARIINIACLTLAIYEWFITLDQEIEYFWSGTWTLSRVLFFINRYLPPFLILFSVMLFSISKPSDKLCASAIQFGLFGQILALGIVQAMLILRVWYLFSNTKSVQYGIVALWILSMSLSLAYTGVAANTLKILDALSPFATGPGCRAARPNNYWRILLPGLILHLILYVLTAYRALRNRRILMNAPVLKRLLRDGGVFFFVVVVAVGFAAIGSFLYDVPEINIPVIFSSYLMTVTSIAMNRIMFSIHSLASHLGSETGWLLSNAELRRIDWRKGATEGEIIIERHYDDDDLESYDGIIRSDSVLKMSRVGMFNDDTMWTR